MRRLGLIGAVAWLAGCAGSPPATRPGAAALRHAFPLPPAGRAEEAHAQVVAAARRLVGQREVRQGSTLWSADCSGLVEAAYAQVGLDLRRERAGLPGDDGVRALYRYVQAQGGISVVGPPAPGDLVFLREGEGGGPEGRAPGSLAHVGLVEEVGAQGALTVIQRVGRGVVRYRMSPERPHLARDPASGEVLNDVLRTPGPGRRLVPAGLLFAAYGRVLPAATAPAAPGAASR